MTLRLYDVLETTLADLDRWKEASDMSKEDVIESVRQRVVVLMRHVVVTPLIGTAFAFPGDIDLAKELLAPEGQARIEAPPRPSGARAR